MNRNRAVGLLSDKAAALVQAMSLDELLAADTSGDGEYGPADRQRLEQAKDRVVVRLLNMQNY